MTTAGVVHVTASGPLRGTTRTGALCRCGWFDDYATAAEARAAGDAHLATATDGPAPSAARKREPRTTATGRVLGSDAARAIRRFQPGGPDGYRAATAPDAPLRATRGKAEHDEAAWLDAART